MVRHGNGGSKNIASVPLCEKQQQFPLQPPPPTPPPTPSLRMETWAAGTVPHTGAMTTKLPALALFWKDLCSPCSQPAGYYRGLQLHPLPGDQRTEPVALPRIPSCLHWSLLIPSPHSLTLRAPPCLEPMSCFSTAVLWSWRRESPHRGLSLLLVPLNLCSKSQAARIQSILMSPISTQTFKCPDSDICFESHFSGKSIPALESWPR